MAGPLRDKQNEPFSTTGITDETHVVGEDVTDEIFLDNAPLPGGTIVVVDPSGPTTLTRVLGTPATGEYRAEEEIGRLVFNSAQADLAVEIDYTSIGPKVLARDINRIHARLDASEPVGGIYAAEQTIAAAANIELDPRSEQSVYISLTQNIQLDDFTDLPAGASGLIVLEQDGTGSRTVTFDTAWRQIGSGTLASTASKITLVNWYIRGSAILYTLVPEA